MIEQFERTKLLIGESGIYTLKSSSIVVFGVGGVGSFAVEALVRAGIGKITLVDHDIVCLSNLNRQLPALHSTIGRPKVSVLKERIADINPLCQVKALQEYYQKGNREEFYLKSYDYVVDAIDSIESKVDLIKHSVESKVKIVSAMGAGNRLNPSGYRVGDISETFGCPLAKIIRRKLRELGIEKGVKTVFSPGPIISAKEGGVVGSISFVPPIVGMMLASVVVNEILKNNS